MPKISAKLDSLLAAAILAALFAVILGLTPWLCAGSTTANPEIVPYAAAVFVVASIGLTISIFGDRGMLDLILWFFITFSLAWPGLLQAMTGKLPWGPKEEPASFVTASWILILFMLAYLGVGMVRPRREAVKTTAIPARRDTQWFLVLCLAMGVFGILAVGLGKVLGSGRGAVNELMDEKSSFYPYLIGKEFALAGLLVALAAFRNAQSPRRRRAVLYALVPLALVAILIFNPNTNPRAQTLAFGLAVFVLFAPDMKRWSRAALVCGLVGATFFGLGALKQISTAAGSYSSAPLLDVLKESLFRCDFDTFQQTAAAVDYVERHGPRWGMNIVGAALFFVPRPLWPSKPVDSGNLVAGDLGYAYTNVSCPLPAELYLAFGFVGVVAGGLLLGYFVRRSSNTLLNVARPRQLTFEHCLNAMYCAYAVILFRGSLSSILPLVGFGFIALYLWPLFGVFARRPAHLRTSGAAASG